MAAREDNSRQMLKSAVYLTRVDQSYGENSITNGIELFSFLSKAGYILCYGTLILQGLFLKKIRMGQAPKIAKATSIMAIIGIVLTLIPAIKLYIAGGSVAYTDIFPAFLAVLVLYLNSTPKKQ